MSKGARRYNKAKGHPPVANPISIDWEVGDRFRKWSGEVGTITALVEGEFPLVKVRFDGETFDRKMDPCLFESRL